MRLGRFQLNHISDGSIRLDGGAVFGIVPRVLWERKMRPDGRNRVRLGLNCLLIRTPHEAILVDTGAGRKYSPKSRTSTVSARSRTSLPVWRTWAWNRGTSTW